LNLKSEGFVRDIQELKTKLDQTIQEKDRLKQEITRQEDAAKELKKYLDSRNKSIDELTAKMAIRDLPFDGKGAFVYGKDHTGKERQLCEITITNIKFRGNQFSAELAFDYSLNHNFYDNAKIPLPKNFPFTGGILKPIMKDEYANPKRHSRVEIDNGFLIIYIDRPIGSVQILFHV
jgi:hypothetical protein